MIYTEFTLIANVSRKYFLSLPTLPSQPPGQLWQQGERSSRTPSTLFPSSVSQGKDLPTTAPPIDLLDRRANGSSTIQEERQGRFKREFGNHHQKPSQPNETRENLAHYSLSFSGLWSLILAFSLHSASSCLNIKNWKP